MSTGRNLRIEKLSDSNFRDYESLTNCGKHAGCYCAFWHQKWASVADSQKQQQEAPLINRAMVCEKVRGGFHVGVLAYEGEQLVAWISVGPLTDFYWTWKRMIQVGEASKTVAGILCITVADAYRGQGLQAELLRALALYAKSQGWTTLEGYPFDASALEKHKDDVLWPGVAKGFESAGFVRQGPHWLSNPNAERSIFTLAIA